MPRLTTLVTELATALGMTGAASVDVGLARPPSEIVGVSAEQWNALSIARRAGEMQPEFETAFVNGRAFLDAADGLRGRGARVIEWKGEHKDPVPAPLPVDLRVDHVYLVSCKYGSKVLGNHSPHALIDGLLEGSLTRQHAAEAGDWFRLVAPEAYADLWAMMREFATVEGLPADPAEMDVAQRKAASKMFPRSELPPPLAAAYTEMSAIVSRHSAARLNDRLGPLKGRQRERFLWRLLRIGTAPYFILGSSGKSAAAHSNRPVRLRIGTPWDVHQVSTFRGLRVVPVEAGQPRLNLVADYTMSDGALRQLVLHVEIRWSHGKFGGAPEAKVYLDSPPAHVPGYFPLEPPDGQFAF